MKSTEIWFDEERIFGDDFSQAEIEAWYRDEARGYATLKSLDRETYQYKYHELNRKHLWSHLPGSQRFDHACGFGSAFGDELRPLAHRVRRITIVEPAREFWREEICGVPVRYVEPRADGSLPLEDHSVDLITCLGVLHHIPNVTHVLTEFTRKLRPGGYLAVREPIVSMGDWRSPRRGLTARERGIPLRAFHRLVQTLQLEVVNMALCDFPLTAVFSRLYAPGAFNSPALTAFDALLSRWFGWNANYHPQSFVDRFRPCSVAVLLKKKTQ